MDEYKVITSIVLLEVVTHPYPNINITVPQVRHGSVIAWM